jgi:hypothetical protein
MARQQIVQKRMGKVEAGQFSALLKATKAFKIFPQQRSSGETKLNAFLINHLLQCDLSIENRNITPAKFVGETFRPECLLRGYGRYPICAVECKKLNDKYALERGTESIFAIFALLQERHFRSV